MPPETLRLSPRHRRWFHATFGLLFLSGALWFVLHTFFPVKTELGLEARPAEAWLLKLHGGAAMLALFILGTLLPLHLRRGWRAHRNRATGVAMTAACVLLGLTGYGLYYAGPESWRHLSVVGHDALGFGLPGVLLWHIFRGRRARPAGVQPKA